MDAIISIHYSQIENKVESEKHIEVRTNATLGVGSSMGWGLTEQCWMYQIARGVNLNSRTSLIFFVLC